MVQTNCIIFFGVPSVNMQNSSGNNGLLKADYWRLMQKQSVNDEKHNRIILCISKLWGGLNPRRYLDQNTLHTSTCVSQSKNTLPSDPSDLFSVDAMTYRPVDWLYANWRVAFKWDRQRVSALTFGRLSCMQFFLICSSIRQPKIHPD